jgi:hypothetical protein
MKAPGISRKLEIVFTFYDHAFYYGFSGRELVGINGPITLKVADGAHHAGAGRGVRREWVCGEGKNPGMVRRPTPDETAVQ